MKYGKKVFIQYAPFGGMMFILGKSGKKYNDTFESLKRIVEQNRDIDVIVTNIIFQPCLLFLKSEHYKQILQNHQDYLKFPMITDNRLITNGLLMVSGSKWKQQRSLLGAHFEYDRLINLIPMINRIADQKLSQIKPPIFPSLSVASSITGEVVLRAFFGEEIAKLSLDGQDPTQSITQLITRFGQLFTKSLIFQLKRAFLGEKLFTFFPTKIEKELYDLNTKMLNHMMKAIKSRIEYLKKQSKIEPKDYLDYYLDAYLNKKMDPPITEEEILQQSITLYFAGTETTANLVTTATYFLAQNQQLQQELYEEIQQVIGQEPQITSKHLQGLQKVTGFLMETLRLKPVAPMLISKEAQKDLYIGDYFIKKGWYVNYLMLANSLNEQYFDEPNKINVSRWKSDGTLKETIHDSYTFVPFSAGGRNCIGQYLALIESKIVISKILTNFKLLLNENIKQVEWISKVTYGLSNQDYVKWESRNKK